MNLYNKVVFKMDGNLLKTHCYKFVDYPTEVVQVDLQFWIIKDLETGLFKIALVTHGNSIQGPFVEYVWEKLREANLRVGGYRYLKGLTKAIDKFLKDYDIPVICRQRRLSQSSFIE